MRTLILFTMLSWAGNCYSQTLPSLTENLDFAVTFGKDANKNWGDDDHVQIVFFIIPKERTAPFYIRIFDPDTGGKHDALHTLFNTKTTFGVYGGNKCFSDTNARKATPTHSYKSGSLLGKRTFKNESQFDNKWYTFGPFNPKEGEFIPQYNAYVFKLVIEGGEGDDGNLYKVSLSDDAQENSAINGGNIFTYEYTFRLKPKKGILSHITPFIGDNIDEIHIKTFDFDEDGEILLYSIAKNRHVSSKSGNGDWKTGVHKIVPEEYNATIDIQIIKGSASENDLTISLTNKYNTAIPMFSVPIGGLPVYPLKIVTQSYFDD